MIKLLILAANPRDTDPLRLGQEVRTIESRLRAGSEAGRIAIRSVWAVTADELIYQLNAFEPNIVHFIGHGERSGEIVLEDEIGASRAVSPVALGRVFAGFGQWLQLVVLNACYSEVQAQVLVEKVDAVIGMADSVSDAAAIEFSASLYRAIGFGRSVKDAFDQATAALVLHGLREEQTPVLQHRTGVDPAKLTLAGPTDLAMAIRRAEDARVPEVQRALLRAGTELVLVPDLVVHVTPPHAAEENRIFLSLRMRQSDAVFVVEVNRLAKIAEVAAHVALRLLPTEARHYEWTLVKKQQHGGEESLAGELSLLMSGLKTGDEVLLTGNHLRPTWAPQQI